MTESTTRATVTALLAATLTLMIWPALKVATSVAAVPLTVLLAAGTAWFIHRKLPAALVADLAALAGRRRVLTILWLVLMSAGVVQTGRQSLYTANPDRSWWLTTKQALWANHACMVAYVYAADLLRQGEPNIYAAEHYPGMNPTAEIHTTVKNLVPEDPYVYPPQFLMLPRLGIALSDDFRVIRAVWYSLQAVFMVALTLLIARWYGGRNRTALLALTPLMWFTVPAIYSLQYGQIHVTSYLLATASYFAFDRRRNLSGGALLALSILCKGYGVFLLIPLLMWRRWPAVAWTSAWAISLTIVSVLVLGTETFEAFFTYHLPRMRTGEAFAFEAVWPEFRTVLLAGNLSLFSLVRKLGDWGVGGMTDGLARIVQTLFTLAVFAAAFLSAKVAEGRDRALFWLVLLNLASLTTPAAWGDYVTFGTLWMMFFLVGDIPQRLVAPLAVAGVLMATVPGAVPYGDTMSATLSYVLSLVLTVVLLTVNGWSFRRNVVTA